MVEFPKNCDGCKYRKICDDWNNDIQSLACATLLFGEEAADKWHEEAVKKRGGFSLGEIEEAMAGRPRKTEAA